MGYIAMLENDVVPLIPSFSKSVVVVGAGLAGLAAAREFKKAGMDVVILEAADRPGGRCYTMSSPEFSNGVYGEAGGMRFPDSHKILMKYLDIFQLEKIPFTNMREKDGIMFFDGVKTSVQDELKNPESLMARVVAKWDESISSLRQAVKDATMTWNDVIKRYSKTSLYDFLKSESEWSDELIKGFSKYGLGLGAYGSILDLSFIEILRLFVKTSYESGNYQLKGGMESLVKSFLFDKKYPLHTSLRYGCKVTSVQKAADGRYEVVYFSETAGSSLSHECDFAILTVPLPNLSKITFNPPLSPIVQEAFRDTHYVRAIKIFLQTRTPFWLEQGFDGMLISDLSIKNTYFAPPFPDSKKGLITASYVMESDADVFLDLPDEEKVRRAVDDLTKVFPEEMPEQFERGAAVEWKEGFCIFRPVQMEKYHAILRDEVSPNVFLAGEHCSVEHGYFEGALESGLRAAANVFRRLDDSFYFKFESILTYGMERNHSLSCWLADSRSNNDLFKESCGSLQRIDSYDTDEFDFPSSASLPQITNRKFVDYQVTSPGLPIPVGRLDHYTLICEDAKKVADFHIDVLQFRFLRIQKVNTGTVATDDVDMVNYILSPPGNPDIVMVVTEGLNDDTIFRKYMKKYGCGVHHIAFEVENVDQAFALVKKAQIKTTAPRVTKDTLSGLKQFFIDPCHAGFFIELIERPKKTVHRSTESWEFTYESESTVESSSSSKSSPEAGFFTQNNMAELARSIGEHVRDDHVFTSTDFRANGAEEKEGTVGNGGESHFGQEKTVEMLEETMKAVSVGAIMLMGVKVKCPKTSAKFLIQTLGFRLIRYEHERDRTYLRLPGNHCDVPLFFEKPPTPEEERRVTVSFALPEIHHIKDSPSVLKAFVAEGSQNDSVLRLPSFYTSYDIEFASPQVLSSMACIVRYSGTDLYVDIGTDRQTILDFLQDPSNLPKWTGHRAIHFSATNGQWMETRIGPEGALVDTVVKVDLIAMSRIRVEWPEREVTMMFDCLQKSDDCCSLVAKFPTNLSEGRLALLKQIIGLEMNLLKALLEGNQAACIPDRIFHQIQAYHLKIYGMTVRNRFSSDILIDFPFKGEVLTQGDLLKQMSTDFAQTIHSAPQALLRPIGVTDVQNAVKIATELGLRLSARGSQISHSAGGQAQADDGLLLDMSTFTSIEFVGSAKDNKAMIKIGAGTMWHEVIRYTLDQGLMPPVLNDYQYLSVGGTISMGGVGFMSHKDGIQAGYVDEMEVVTGRGNLAICSNRVNKKLFDGCRGGLGQFGIITSVTIPLVQAPKDICIFKVFYEQSAGARFIKDIEDLVNFGRVELIHSFLKPCSQKSISTIVGAKKWEASSPDFKANVKSGETRGDVVFFLELGCYIWEDGTSQVPEIEAHLNSSLQFMDNVVFQETLDFYSYITRDPPVVECNKAHGGSVPHPSFATVVGRADTLGLINLHLESANRGDDSINEILIIPMKSNATLHRGYHVPMFPMPERSGQDDDALSFFLLFLGSVIPTPTISAEESMQTIRKHHRFLYNHSISVGGKRYSYDTITNEVRGEALWKEHYGEYTWHQICTSKRAYDPLHVLSPGVHMWDLS